jgi:hypothetical protein
LSESTVWIWHYSVSVFHPKKESSE